MSALDDIRAQRLKKLELLEEKGIDPYPAHTDVTHTLVVVRSNFAELEKAGTGVTVGGRVMSLRGQGGIVFADLYDGTDTMQVLVRKDDVGVEAFELFTAVVDASDFIEITGTVLVTKRGEQSVLAKSWRMLAKSLRPVPDQWYGLKDEDERYRKRYLDILLNPVVADRVRKRSVFWNTIRAFMLARGFVEVETPVLETLTGGAEARPFVTHHNALAIDVYLRISVGELWQKKLMVAGIPKTFEIGRIFRNEGMSAEHANDYTSFEFYEAYKDYRDGMTMLTELYRTVAQETFGTQQFTINGFEVDLAREWNVYDFNELMHTAYGIDPREATREEVLAKLKAENIEHDKNIDLGRGVDLLWKKIRRTMGGPDFLVGIPVYLEPLAKRAADDPRVVERFQILIGGSELGKAFSELNNPIDQRARFEEQQALRDKGDEEAQMADFEYVEAMEYGMPPALGFGVSERLFAFLAGVSIREGQIFPLMRPKGD